MVASDKFGNVIDNVMENVYELKGLRVLLKVKKAAENMDPCNLTYNEVDDSTRQGRKGGAKGQGAAG